MVSDPLRILYISHSHPPEGEPLKNLGGMQRVSMQLTSELERREDVELHTLILKTPWKGIAIRTAGFLARLMLMLPGQVKKINADVIVFSSMVTASTALFVGKRLSIPMVAITHGQDVTLPNRPYQWLVPKIFNRLSGVIAVSEATKKACINRGMKQERVRALANGLNKKDQELYPEFAEARNRLKSSLELNLEGQSLLLTVGRLVRRKGHERFIRHILPFIKGSVRYLVIGNGPQKEAIQQAIRDTGQGDKVVLAGRQPDAVLKDAYSASDLFIMPNIPVKGDMEGFGIVLLEANLASTPAVASDLEGIKDVIEDGENGYRIEVGNNKAFAQKVNNLLYEQDLQEFGQKARQYVLARFSWEQVADSYVNFLQEIVQGR